LGKNKFISTVILNS